MRIIELTLQNYRVHREVTVRFEAGLTLIGGPNECGKSTIVEALHRALFLKAVGNTAEHRAMTPLSAASGPATVSVRFHAAGKNWTLRKVFGGKGSATLGADGGTSLSGDAAETRLATLLGVDGPTKGSGLQLQWAHLWLWQGTSGYDPTDPEQLPQARLTRSLQDQAGGVLLSSVIDDRLIRHFEGETSRYFTPANGRPTAELADAMQALSASQERHTKAVDRLRRFETAIDDFEDANRLLEQNVASARSLASERSQLEEQKGQLSALRAQEAREVSDVEKCSTAHADLLSHHNAIAGKAARLDELGRAIKPLSNQVSETESAATAAQGVAATAEETRTNSHAVSAKRRADYDLLQAFIHHRQAEGRLAELVARETDRQNATKELERLRTERARLPAVDAKILQQLTRLESERMEADAQVRSLATGLELLASDLPVHAGPLTLKRGEPVTITTETELSVGSSCVIRLRPGGGVSLADAKSTQAKIAEELSSLLGSLGLATVAAAQEARTAIDILTGQIKAAEKALGSREFSSLSEELNAARTAVTSAHAQLERLRNASTDAPLPDNLKAAEFKLSTARAAQETASEEAKQADESASSARKHAEKLRGAAEEQRRSLAEKECALRELETELRLLRATHGDDVTRATRLADANQAVNAAKTCLSQTQEAIKALQPDLLERTAVRLSRAEESLRREHTAQNERLIAAQALLRSDGTEDPVRDLADAVAALRRAEAHHDALVLEANSVRLARDTFREAQQALAERFTHPLVERIGGYLSCVFGPGTKVVLRHTPERFDGLSLVRADGAAIPFPALSGGAREQVAAAVRLAAAEFLAKDYDGTLPMVFDDSFAYSDPVRVRDLQSMLDLAASRSLQVIVLTCTPADYATLGAHTHSLGT